MTALIKHGQGAHHLVVFKIHKMMFIAKHRARVAKFMTDETQVIWPMAGIKYVIEGGWARLVNEHTGGLGVLWGSWLNTHTKHGNG